MSTAVTPRHTDPDQAQRHRLSPEQVRRFHEDGLLGPFPAMTPAQMDALRPAIDAVLQSDPPHARQKRDHNRHLDSPVIRDLALLPTIVGPMTCILGPDLLLWRAHFWVKQPGALEIPWHQDANYWPIEPAIVLSAWIAIDEATIENSCVQAIPGSHRKIVPHVQSPPGMEFHTMADPAHVDTSRAIDLVMKPGEFFLFNERTLHHSFPNRSNKRRLGLALRVIIPIVRVMAFDHDHHRMLTLAGEDRMGFNPLVA